MLKGKYLFPDASNRNEARMPVFQHNPSKLNDTNTS